MTEILESLLHEVIICSALCFYEFLERRVLLLCLNNIYSKLYYAHVNGLGHRSCVDHSLLSESLYEFITECSVNVSPLNTSDHWNRMYTLARWIYTQRERNVLNRVVIHGDIISPTLSTVTLESILIKV